MDLQTALNKEGKVVSVRDGNENPWTGVLLLTPDNKGGIFDGEDWFSLNGKDFFFEIEHLDIHPLTETLDNKFVWVKDNFGFNRAVEILKMRSNPIYPFVTPER